MAITLEAIRAAGGIVHSDGNIFFRDISMLQGLAGAAPAAVAPLPLPQVLEQIAQSWDGCMYDAPGENLDIGADIRAAAARLLAEQPSAVAGPAIDRAATLAAIDDLSEPSWTGYECPNTWADGLSAARAVVLSAPAAPALEAPAAPAVPALEAPAAPAVPAGFALVPIEPTQEMLNAGRWSGAGSVSIQEEWARKEMWCRMLATITPPPAAYTDDLVALVENLAQALSAAAPDNDLAGHALEYLKRNGLQGSPLWAAEAAPQAPAAPAVDVETIHLQDLKNALAECAALRQQLTLMDEQQAGTVWRWQADGQDQLASMGNRMGVLIYACDLRALLAGAAPAVDASDTALLDAMQRHRIALVPEFEGPWDAEIFNDEAEAHPIASGATPREALRAALAAQAKEGGA